MSLVLDGISLIAGQETLIDAVSLTLDRGEMHVLLGPTLAGKTTLLRLMAGLDKPSSGRLLLDGKDVTSVPVRQRSVAMVYQQFINYPTLTVFENIASPLRVARLPRTEIDQRVHHAATLLRLKPLLQRLPSQLSGGQQQRTAIARALVKRADVVLLDEPLANLDYKLREELREQLPRIFIETNAILVYATTEPTEALLLGGQTATVWQGRITQHGPGGEVYRRPRNLPAMQVFSDPPLNELAADKRGSVIVTMNGRQLPAIGVLVNLPDGPYRIGFRCDGVTLNGGGPGLLSFPGIVSVAELSGSESFVHVDVGATTWVCLVRGIHDWQPGAQVEVFVDMHRAMAFDTEGRVVASPAMAEIA